MVFSTQTHRLYKFYAVLKCVTILVHKSNKIGSCTRVANNNKNDDDDDAAATAIVPVAMLSNLNDRIELNS